jgi:hypothetical protein
MFLNFLNFFRQFLLFQIQQWEDPEELGKLPLKVKETKIVCRYCGLEGPKIIRTSYKGMVKKLFFLILKSTILKRV